MFIMINIILFLLHCNNLDFDKDVKAKTFYCTDFAKVHDGRLAISSVFHNPLSSIWIPDPAFNYRQGVIADKKDSAVDTTLHV